MIKLIGVSFLIGSSVFFTSIVGAGAYLVTGGIMVCDVETPEVNLTIPVPTRLADMAFLVARVALPDEDREEIRREIGPFLPFIDELFGGLVDIDNGTTLVSVETGQETVLIEKRRGKFLIDVDAEDAKVRVSIPARSLRRLSGEIKYLF
ncbi:MAG: hypothetical protein VYE73_10990 [Acidobacteriota bacterium]|nr:hypothetical protein [Acidobacteriota bacterium]